MLRLRHAAVLAHAHAGRSRGRPPASRTLPGPAGAPGCGPCSGPSSMLPHQWGSAIRPTPVHVPEPPPGVRGGAGALPSPTSPAAMSGLMLLRKVGGCGVCRQACKPNPARHPLQPSTPRPPAPQAAAGAASASGVCRQPLAAPDAATTSLPCRPQPSTRRRACIMRSGDTGAAPISGGGEKALFGEVRAYKQAARPHAARPPHARRLRRRRLTLCRCGRAELWRARPLPC